MLVVEVLLIGGSSLGGDGGCGIGVSGDGGVMADMRMTVVIERVGAVV